MRTAALALALSSIALTANAPPASPEQGEVMLTAADLNPGVVLPAPPAADSIQGEAEMAELRAIETARSEADLAAARHDSETKNASIFADVLGPAFDLDKLPATRALFAVVRSTERDAADRGKAEFHRPRPWIVEPALKTCSRDDDPLSSYPSGHTTMAYSMGAVLARLVPSKAPEIMTRAAVYGQSRIVCEQHFRSDVTAGEALGLSGALRPEWHPFYRGSRREPRQSASGSHQCDQRPDGGSRSGNGTPFPSCCTVHCRGSGTATGDRSGQLSHSRHDAVILTRALCDTIGRNIGQAARNGRIRWR